MNIHILGCGSALPTLHHNNAAQVAEINGSLYLIDCGEGTQLWLRRARLSFARLKAVFITHLHGDHVFGLIGLISSFNLLGRTTPLHIYAPAPLQQPLEQQIQMFCRDMRYETIFHPIDTTLRQTIYEDKKATVETIPLSHGIPCAGFIIREKKNPQNAYAYCSDTSYLPNLHKDLQDIHTIYHEATYAQDNADKAQKYNHSTAQQAATVARDANAQQLYIGHYSQRYDNEEILLQEAQKIFQNTHLTTENMVIHI